jgi:ribulose-phosphate 3-epimerase
MIRHPKNYIKEFVDAGSQYITFHIEADCNAKEVIDLIHSYGIKAGISIKPKTPVKVIEELLPYLDMVLIMSVEPGFGGQKFMPNSIEKAKRLKELKEEFGYNYLINIDGGINDKTLPQVKDYLDLAVSGSFVCNAEDQMENLKKLQEM